MRTESLVSSLEALGGASRRGRYLVRRIRDPREALDPGQKAALLEVFVAAASQMVGSDIARYWEQRDDYFDQLAEWWLVTCDEEIAGWCGLDLLTEEGPEDLIYVDTLGFLPAHQRGGLATLLAVEPWLRISVERRAPLTMTFRTQSPAVMRVAAAIAGPDTYPYPTSPGERSGARAAEVAAFVSARLSPASEFDPAGFACRGAFSYMPSTLYGEDFPWSGDPGLDTFFEREIDLDAGDAVIGVMLGTPRLALRSASIWGRTMRRLVGSDRR